MPSGIYERTTKHKTSITGSGNPFYGKQHSEKSRTKMRENHKGMTGKKMPKWFSEFMRQERTGSKNPIWKGGRYCKYGYIFILDKSHPRANQNGYVKRSRLVMEKHLNRFLTKDEVVHHINEIKDDDRIINLTLFSCTGEHTKHHNHLRRLSKLRI